MKPSCNECKFFVQSRLNDIENNMGDCRRFPPTPIMHPPNDVEAKPYLLSQYPNVDGTDFCGEFRQADVTDQ